MYRADRTSGMKGGGIVCWIRSSFSSSMVFCESIYSDVELLITRISYKAFHCLLVLLYFPHGGTLSIERQRHLCDYVISTTDDYLERYPGSAIYLAGDFNHVDSSPFEIAFGIENIVFNPTRMNAILDLVLIPDQYADLYSKPMYFPPFGMSDHNVILIKPTRKFCFHSSFIKVIDYRESFLTQARVYLSCIDWTNILENLDLDNACKAFYVFLKNAIELLPTDVVKRKTSDKPWITNVIKTMINKRYKAYRDKNWPLLSHYMDKVKKMICTAKQSWSKTYLRANTIWDLHKVVTNHTSESGDWLQQCDPDRNINDILEDVNHQIFSEFISDPIEYRPLPIIIPFQFTEKEVKAHLENVNPKSSYGSDSISSMVWSKLASVLTQPLTVLYNKCLKVADLPL